MFGICQQKNFFFISHSPLRADHSWILRIVNENFLFWRKSKSLFCVTFPLSSPIYKVDIPISILSTFATIVKYKFKKNRNFNIYIYIHIYSLFIPACIQYISVCVICVCVYQFIVLFEPFVLQFEKENMPKGFKSKK